MLLPTNGMTVAKGYITGFFYLAAWGPLFVILNMIFMSRWQDSLASWDATGGMTAANFYGISAVIQDVAAIAGTITLTLPFHAACLAKCALATSYHPSSFFPPHQTASYPTAGHAHLTNYSFRTTLPVYRHV